MRFWGFEPKSGSWALEAVPKRKDNKDINDIKEDELLTRQCLRKRSRGLWRRGGKATRRSTGGTQEYYMPWRYQSDIPGIVVFGVSNEETRYGFGPYWTIRGAILDVFGRYWTLLDRNGTIVFRVSWGLRRGLGCLVPRRFGRDHGVGDFGLSVAGLKRDKPQKTQRRGPRGPRKSLYESAWGQGLLVTR
jgi:hypothetical protein